MAYKSDSLIVENSIMYYHYDRRTVMICRQMVDGNSNPIASPPIEIPLDDLEEVIDFLKKIKNTEK